MIARLTLAIVLLALSGCIVSTLFDRRVAELSRAVQLYCGEVSAELREAYRAAIAKRVTPNRVQIDCARDQQVTP